MITVRARPNLLKDNLRERVGMEGISLKTTETALPALRARIVDGDKVHWFSNTLSERDEHFSESSLTGPENAGLREIVNQLKLTRTVRRGGRWVVFQLREGRLRVIANGERQSVYDLLDPPAIWHSETDRVFAKFTRDLATRPAGIAVHFSVSCYREPLVAEYEGFYFRNLNGNGDRDGNGKPPGRVRVRE